MTQDYRWVRALRLALVQRTAQLVAGPGAAAPLHPSCCVPLPNVLMQVWGGRTAGTWSACSRREARCRTHAAVVLWRAHLALHATCCTLAVPAAAGEVCRMRGCFRHPPRDLTTTLRTKGNTSKLAPKEMDPLRIGTRWAASDATLAAEVPQAGGTGGPAPPHFRQPRFQ